MGCTYSVNMYIVWMVEFADKLAVVDPLFCKWVGNSSSIAHMGVIIYNTGKTAIYTKYINSISIRLCPP